MRHTLRVRPGPCPSSHALTARLPGDRWPRNETRQWHDSVPPVWCLSFSLDHLMKSYATLWWFVHPIIVKIHRRCNCSPLFFKIHKKKAKDSILLDNFSIFECLFAIFQVIRHALSLARSLKNTSIYIQYHTLVLIVSASALAIGNLCHSAANQVASQGQFISQP